MSVDLIRILRQHNVSFYEHGEDPHAGEGWIQLDCPFCRDGQPHLGWNQDAQVFKCWHCGRHPVVYTLSLLLGIGTSEAKNLLEANQLRGSPQRKTRHAPAQKLMLPGTTGPLNVRCARYLALRGFNPIKLTKVWRLACTAPTDRADWADRIIVPICDLEGEACSYQGRTIQPDVVPPYRSCPPEFERAPHKSLLYGAHLARGMSVIVVVEGVVDAWRLGPGAVATFGTGYTDEQVELICRWPRRVIMYDQDAIAEGQKLAARCSAHRGETLLGSCIYKDPGCLPASVAAALRLEVLGQPPVDYNEGGCAAGDGSA